MGRRIEIYTDGACSGNPGPGGWGAILRTVTADGREIERELSGGERQTTNNRMELTAAIESLRALTEPCEVALHSDSSYLVHAFTLGWLANWQRNGWRKKDKGPVENQDLWQILLGLSQTHRVTFVKVKGHATDVLNNRCDKLARAAVVAITSAVPT